MTRNLKNWDALDAKGFLDELKKQKVELKLAQKQERLEYFETEKAETNRLSVLIKQTYDLIDQMVFDLYELMEEERRIVLDEE